jgi:hypothetical protein
MAELDDILYRYKEITAFSAELADDGGGEILNITAKLKDDASVLPTIPELQSLPVKAELKKGDPDFHTTGVIKRRIQDKREARTPAHNA